MPTATGGQRGAQDVEGEEGAGELPALRGLRGLRGPRAHPEAVLVADDSGHCPGPSAPDGRRRDARRRAESKAVAAKPPREGVMSFMEDELMALDLTDENDPLPQTSPDSKPMKKAQCSRGQKRKVGALVKPPTEGAPAYQLFYEEKKQLHDSIPLIQVAKLLVSAWSSLSWEQKQVYIDKAGKSKDLIQNQDPDTQIHRYRYTNQMQSANNTSNRNTGLAGTNSPTYSSNEIEMETKEFSESGANNENAIDFENFSEFQWEITRQQKLRALNLRHRREIVYLTVKHQEATAILERERQKAMELQEQIQCLLILPSIMAGVDSNMPTHDGNPDNPPPIPSNNNFDTPAPIHLANIPDIALPENLGRLADMICAQPVPVDLADFILNLPMPGNPPAAPLMQNLGNVQNRHHPS